MFIGTAQIQYEIFITISDGKFDIQINMKLLMPYDFIL